MCGGQLTSTCTSLAPASLRLFTRALQVVPRTIESSTTITRLPFTSSSIRLSFTRTSKSRMSCEGWRKLRPDIVVADEGHLEGDARFQRVAQRGAVAAVGHGHHHVGLDREFARELPAHLDAHLVDVAVGDGAVGPGEIDVFEDAERAALVLGKGLHAGQAVLVDDHDLARLDVADELGVDQVQGAGFAGQHPGVVELAEAQRAEPVRVAHADQLLLGHDDQRVGALDAAQASAPGCCRGRCRSAGPSGAG